MNLLAHISIPVQGALVFLALVLSELSDILKPLITTFVNSDQVKKMAKLSPKDYEYRRTESSVSSINYHFVFVRKRRKAVLVGNVAQRLQEIIFELVTEHGWKLIALEIMPDHSSDSFL